MATPAYTPSEGICEAVQQLSVSSSDSRETPRRPDPMAVDASTHGCEPRPSAPTQAAPAVAPIDQVLEGFERLSSQWLETNTIFRRLSSRFLQEGIYTPQMFDFCPVDRGSGKTNFVSCPSCRGVWYISSQSEDQRSADRYRERLVSFLPYVQACNACHGYHGYYEFIHGRGCKFSIVVTEDWDYVNRMITWKYTEGWSSCPTPGKIWPELMGNPEQSWDEKCFWERVGNGMAYESVHHLAERLQIKTNFYSKGMDDPEFPIPQWTARATEEFERRDFFIKPEETESEVQYLEPRFWDIPWAHLF